MKDMSEDAKKALTDFNEKQGDWWVYWNGRRVYGTLRELRLKILEIKNAQSAPTDPTGPATGRLS